MGLEWMDEAGGMLLDNAQEWGGRIGGYGNWNGKGERRGATNDHFAIQLLHLFANGHSPQICSFHSWPNAEVPQPPPIFSLRKWPLLLEMAGVREGRAAPEKSDGEGRRLMGRGGRGCQLPPVGPSAIKSHRRTAGAKRVLPALILAVC